MAQLESREPFLYEDVAAKIERMIELGTFRPGDRIPSIRELSRQMRVSVNTVMEAYVHLESQRIIEARPQSGFYVRERLLEPEAHPAMILVRRNLGAKTVCISDAAMQAIRDMTSPSLLPLGLSTPNPEHMPIDKLNRMMASQTRRFGLDSVACKDVMGIPRLRIQIARLALDSGCSLSPDDVIITSGCMESVHLALQAVCRVGSTIAVASPVYHSFLSAAQVLGLKVLEVPSDPREGMKLDFLDYAIKHTSIQACYIISNFNNPLGSLMPDTKKRELVKLLARHDIPLIEDDVCGDLSFSSSRPVTAKSFDKKGLVLLCSSFSKTLAPGFRVGWIAPGRYKERIAELRTVFNMVAAAPSQLAIAEFLSTGGYSRHLKIIRSVYSKQFAYLREAVGRYFPEGTRATRPEGGFLLWVELPDSIDTLWLHERALQNGISVASGFLFTNSDKFRTCIRLNASYWSSLAEKSLKILGALAQGRIKAGVA